MNRVQQIVLIVLVPVVVLGALFIGRASTGDEGSSGVQVADAGDATTFEHDYTIPAGTADRIEAGEFVEIVPLELTVKVGEAIRIVNEDDEGHVVGVFFVGAGETMTQRFTAPGELSGACSVHSDGEFTLRVVA
jgi:plastocyanin